jgi:hypothetical protein
MTNREKLLELMDTYSTMGALADAIIARFPQLQEPTGDVSEALEREIAERKRVFEITEREWNSIVDELQREIAGRKRERDEAREIATKAMREVGGLPKSHPLPAWNSEWSIQKDFVIVSSWKEPNEKA